MQRIKDKFSRTKRYLLESKAQQGPVTEVSVHIFIGFGTLKQTFINLLGVEREARNKKETEKCV